MEYNYENSTKNDKKTTKPAGTFRRLFIVNRYPDPYTNRSMGRRNRSCGIRLSSWLLLCLRLRV